MIERVEYVHSKHFIHRDIKPDNFVIGINQNINKIYLIDFGLAKRYKTTLGQHIPFKEDKKLTGTVRYASINTQLGIEMSRRDDLESLGYILLYLLKGKLPWFGLDCENKFKKYEMVLKEKINSSPSTLCYG